MLYVVDRTINMSMQFRKKKKQKIIAFLGLKFVGR